MDHTILLKSLEIEVSMGHALVWFKMFLMDQSQISVDGDWVSECDLPSGVPQGSVLSPCYPISIKLSGISFVVLVSDAINLLIC